MSAMQAKAFPELTGLELNDMCIPGERLQHIWSPVILIELQIETAIADTTQWTESRSLDRLVDFIIKGMLLFPPLAAQPSFLHSAPHVAQEALAKVQVTRCTNFAIHCRSSPPRSRCDQSSQE